MPTLLAIDTDDPQDLLLAHLHGSVEGLAHGGRVLVDGHHAIAAIVLQQRHVASILLRLLRLALNRPANTITNSPSTGNSFS